MIEPVPFLLRKVGEFAALLGGSLGLIVHIFYEVVGIHYRSLAALHLAFRELYHSVAEVINLAGPVKAELAENQLEHLEVVVLLIAHHIDVGIEAVLREAALCRSEVLGNINRSAVAAKHELAVESVGSEVAPYRTVRVGGEDAHIQALLHEFLAEKVGVVLIVHLVEADAKAAVGLVEPFKYPAVHHFPKGADLGVALLPFDEHIVGFLHTRGGLFGLILAQALLHELRGLLLEHIAESNIAVAYQMVPLLAGGLRGGAVEELLPRKHRLAYMDAAVVDQGGLDDLVACGLQDVGH